MCLFDRLRYNFGNPKSTKYYFWNSDKNYIANIFQNNPDCYIKLNLIESSKYKSTDVV